MIQLTHRFENAMVYASQIHAAQRRKGSNTPYIAHLLGVAALTLEAGGDEDQAIAALLHDAVEDQGGEGRLLDIKARFGERAAKIVQDCTDADTLPKPPWRARKEEYLATLGAKSLDSLLVSLADKTYNAEAIVADLEMVGDTVWSRFNAGRDEVVWYYQSLTSVFEQRLPAASKRLARAAALMQPARSFRGAANDARRAPSSMEV